VQPSQKVREGEAGIPTWQYVHDKKIVVCLVPIKGTDPIFVDLSKVVEDHIGLISDWLCSFVRRRSEAHVAQALKIARHFQDAFVEAQEVVHAAHLERKCPGYILDAFNEAEGADDVADLLRSKLEAHLKVLARDLQRR
jgi:hypothetical protein